MDSDYPIEAFRSAFTSTASRVLLFTAAFWGGSLVGEYTITHHWHNLGLLPLSSLFHVALAITHLWGIGIVAGIGWIFYVLLWRDAPIVSSVMAVFSLQVASINLFTPDWMRIDDPNEWALITKVFCTFIGVIFFVLANKRLSET